MDRENSKNIASIQNLKLSDYKEIRTRFCFLDESGSLSDDHNPFFTIGMIKCTQPYYIQDKLRSERSKKNFYDELKFNKLSNLNLDFACSAMDSFFKTKSMYFASYTLDKEGQYFKNTFGGDPWKAYEAISIRLLESNVHDDEILIVIADHITTPHEIKFEVDVKRKVNDEKKRLAIAGVCRIDSKANDLLQLADLFIGAVNYDLKLTTGLTKKGDRFKRKLSQYFKQCLGAKDFLNGFKNFNANIFVDKNTQQRLPMMIQNKANEKRPSS